MSYGCSLCADPEIKAGHFVSDSRLSKGPWDSLSWNRLAPWHCDKEKGEQQTGKQY